MAPLNFLFTSAVCLAAHPGYVLTCAANVLNAAAERGSWHRIS